MQIVSFIERITSFCRGADVLGQNTQNNTFKMSIKHEEEEEEVHKMKSKEFNSIELNTRSYSCYFLFALKQTKTKVFFV